MRFFGPATVGLNEFNPLFIRDGLQTQLFGLFGNYDTWGDQIILSGLSGPVSFSISQFAADSDGFRANNDNRIRHTMATCSGKCRKARAFRPRSRLEQAVSDLISAFDPEFVSDVSSE
jgi:hypothetical protein